MRKIGYGQALAIVAVFIALGPPVGALTFSLLGGAGALLTGQPQGTAGMIFYGGLLSIALAWFIGGIQAALAGIATAVFALFTGRVSILVAMVAGLACGLVYIYGEGLDTTFAVLLLCVHIVSSLACALIARAIK
ncbi:MAG: hypothetical protein KF810_09940 [Rhizobiaceae bacterium]|nr:hypothetical protein [Rhizobiaceae bacterium]